MKDKHILLQLDCPDWLSSLDILEKAVFGNIAIPPGYEVVDIIEEPYAPTDKERKYRLILKPIAQ